MSSPMVTTYAAALAWLANGFKVLPVQPNSKRLIAGFGLFKNQLSLDDVDSVRFWFQERRGLNLALLCPEDVRILDFDNPGLYDRFKRDSPAAAKSYTERTPRGGAHVFVRVEGSANFAPIAGLEVKRLAVSWPSVVDGKPYIQVDQIDNGALLTFRLAEALRGFGESRPEEMPRVTAARAVGLPVGFQGDNLGIVTKAKQAWPILPYLAFFAPRLKLTGSGRWRSAACPWHKDARPSLWVDTERGLWGCHACGAHGDVVNWHARLKGFDQVRAARDLIQYSHAVRVEA